MKKLALVFALSIICTVPVFGGGLLCKIIIDDGNGRAAASDLLATFDTIEKALANDFAEYLTADEKAQALKLSYETCEIAEKVDAFAAKLRAWYTATAKKHANDPEYNHGAAGAGTASPTGSGDGADAADVMRLLDSTGSPFVAPISAFP